MSQESYTLPSFIEHQLREVAEIEPLLKLSLNKINSLPINYQPYKLESLDALEIIEAQIDFDIDHLILLPNLEIFERELVIKIIKKLLQIISKTNNILILSTDEENPQDLEFITTTHSFSLSKISPNINIEQREKVVLFLIQNYRPQYVWNINSVATWNLWRKSAKPISTLSKLNAFIFLSEDSGKENISIQEIDSYRNCMQYINEIYVNNENTKSNIIKLCGLSEAQQKNIINVN